MKAILFNANGDKKGDIELPKAFLTSIREDIPRNPSERLTLFLRWPEYIREVGSSIIEIPI